MSQVTAIEMQAAFERLFEAASQGLKGDEHLTASFHGELSDFVRVNGAQVRQAGHVQQRNLTLNLMLWLTVIIFLNHIKHVMSLW